MERGSALSIYYSTNLYLPWDKSGILQAGRRAEIFFWEQSGIPAKNASTPQLNAMGIAPKVVGERFGDPLLLMLR